MTKATFATRVDRRVSLEAKKARQQAKREARREAKRTELQFPSAYDDSNPIVAGVGRTLSRGLS
jgi:hypothetical protein